MEKIKEQIETQYKKAFFSKIKEDLSKSPPDTEHIRVVIQELISGLCKFVPNKTEVHEFIKKDILYDTIDVETMPKIINGFIHWIEQFQSPIHDSTTKKWRNDFKEATNYSDFIATFLEEYYVHAEKMYKELWEARKRVVNNESAVPPEYRSMGNNGVPDIMRSGRK